MRPDRHAGFALATAIFLVVVLAALGLVIVTVSGLQHTSSARDVMGSKAYQAARAGIEWGAYQILVAQPASPPTACFLPNPTAIAFASGDLSGFTVSVSCARTTRNEGTRTGGTALEFYVITATACNQPPCPNETNPPTPATGPTAAYIERQIQATISR